MKKLMIALFVLVTVFTGYHLTSQANQGGDTLSDPYEKIGQVGEYTLYKDTSQNIFAEALELIYQDQSNKYYLPAIKSHIYRLEKDGVTIGLKEALEDDLININDLKEVLTEMIVVNKSGSDKSFQKIGQVGEYTLYKDTSQQYFAQALEFIYEDEENEYYLRAIMSHIYRLEKDGVTIGLKEALQNNLIDINDLESLIPLYVVKK